MKYRRNIKARTLSGNKNRKQKKENITFTTNSGLVSLRIFYYGRMKKAA